MYHYTECGLKNVWLSNGVVTKQTPYGETTAIKNVKALHLAIGRTIAQSPEKLKGDQVRFLRTEMDWSQKRLASILAVKELTVGRWERNETKVTGPARMALCLLYLSYSENPEITELVDNLAALDRKVSAKELTFKIQGEEWKEAA